MSSQPFIAAEHQASTLHLPPGRWLTVLDCLSEHFSAISREQWLDRIARGRVLETPLTARTLAVDLDGPADSRLVAIAGGGQKVQAIRAVLESGRLTGLITDEQ